jgi:fatty acid-binding protein DegV
MVILHELATPREDVRILMDRLRSLYPATPITIRQYGPSVATFVGTRALGVVVLEAEEE